MKTCKDCYHQKACQAMLEVQGYSVSENYIGDATRCDTFKDKFLILNLPCKVGDTVYYIENQSIKKGIVRQFGYESYLWVVVDVAKTKCVVLKGNLIFPTKESAEQALKEREQG